MIILLSIWNGRPDNFFRISLALVMAVFILSVGVPAQVLQKTTFTFNGQLIPWHHLLVPLLVGAAVCVTLLGGARLSVKKEGLVLLLVLTWLLAGWGNKNWELNTKMAWGLIIKGPLVGWVVWQTCQSYQRALGLLRFIVYSIGLVAFFGIIEFLFSETTLFPGTYHIGHRLTSTVGHPLVLATLMLMGLPTIFVIFRRHPFLSCGLGTLFLGTLLGSMSRGGVLVALLVIVYLWWSESELRGLLKKTIGYVMVLSFAILVFFSFGRSGPQSLISQFGQRFNPSEIVSTLHSSHRTAAYGIARKILEKHWATGGGLR